MAEKPEIAVAFGAVGRELFELRDHLGGRRRAYVHADEQRHVAFVQTAFEVGVVEFVGAGFGREAGLGFAFSEILEVVHADHVVEKLLQHIEHDFGFGVDALSRRRRAVSPGLAARRRMLVVMVARS